jgi:hypothetical protein
MIYAPIIVPRVKISKLLSPPSDLACELPGI